MSNTSSVSSEAIQRLLDRQSISDVLCIYTRATDRLDWDLLRTCFHADATMSYGVFNVPSVDEFIKYGKSQLEAKGKDKLEYEVCSHPLYNQLIEFDTPDRARVETYTTSVSRRWVKGEVINALMYGRYLDVFERRDGRWAISKHVWVLDQYFEVPNDTKDPYWHTADVNRGSFGPNDPLYALMRMKGDQVADASPKN